MFGSTPRRQALLQGLEQMLRMLAQANCATLLLDGSFVTSKALPGDFDLCFDEAGLDWSRLDPVLFDMRHGRAAHKAKYRGEAFPASASADAMGTTFRDFFQQRAGVPKGIVRINLGGSAVP